MIKSSRRKKRLNDLAKAIQAYGVTPDDLKKFDKTEKVESASMGDEGACSLPAMDISDEEVKESHILDIFKMFINYGNLEYFLNKLGCKYERSEEMEESAT